MYSFVEKYAKKHNLEQTLSVLPYAKKMHEGQYRSGKERYPYIFHPLKVACHAISIGLNNDILVSAALLHDVCEDCGVPPEELPVNEETKEIVALLTRDFEAENRSTDGEKSYYTNIAKHRGAIMIKLLDRCNNVSEMAEGFTDQRMERYILKTEKWFYPMIEYAYENYPEYENQLFLIEYHMKSVMDTAKRCFKN